MPKITEGANQVDGIPVRWAAAGAPVGLALWLTHLGGSAEQTQPMLTQLAGRGLLAVSFDPPGHGRRGDGRDAMEMGREVLGAFRRRMWPLAGHAVLELLWVLDWADEEFGIVRSRVAGGVSMGGDIAVALAGIDRRITRVAALVASPDWTRPGMAGARRAGGARPGRGRPLRPVVLRRLRSDHPPGRLPPRSGDQILLRGKRPTRARRGSQGAVLCRQNVPQRPGRAGGRLAGRRVVPRGRRSRICQGADQPRLDVR